MMKKLLVLVLILAFASVASATTWFEVDPLDHKDSYIPNEIITIQVVSDITVGSLNLDISATGGHAEGPATLASGLVGFGGNVINSGGVLLTEISGSTGMNPSIEPSIPLVMFEYHVPDVPESTPITVSATGFVQFDWVYYSATPLDIHVAPEPMTVALLGLGGLFLRRRK